MEPGPLPLLMHGSNAVELVKPNTYQRKIDIGLVILDRAKQSQYVIKY